LYPSPYLSSYYYIYRRTLTRLYTVCYRCALTFMCLRTSTTTAYTSIEHSSNADVEDDDRRFLYFFDGWARALFLSPHVDTVWRREKYIVVLATSPSPPFLPRLLFSHATVSPPHLFVFLTLLDPAVRLLHWCVVILRDSVPIAFHLSSRDLGSRSWPLMNENRKCMEGVAAGRKRQIPKSLLHP